MARKIGQHPQHGDDRDRNSRRQTVQAVGEVGAVRHGRHHENRDQHVENPCGNGVSARQPSVVELVVFDEGDGRLRGLEALGADDHVALNRFEHRAVLVQIDRLHGLRDLLAHDDVGREPHGRSDDDAEAHLPHDLETALQPLLPVAENLDVVVQTADQAEPDRRHEQQLDVDVVQLAEEQHRDQDGDENDHAAHRGRAFLLQLALKPEVADLLADLLAAQEVDDRTSKDNDDQQREDDGCRGAEGDVLEHSRAGEVVGLVQVPE